MKRIIEDSVIKVYECEDTFDIEKILKGKNWLQFKFMGYELIVEEIVKEESFQDVFLNKIVQPYKWKEKDDIKIILNDKIAIPKKENINPIPKLGEGALLRQINGKIVKYRSTEQLYDDIQVRDETIKCLNKEIEDLKNEVERWSGKYQEKHLECADTMILLDAMTNDRNKVWSENISLVEGGEELRHKLYQKYTEYNDLEKRLYEMVKQQDEKNEEIKEFKRILFHKVNEINTLKDEINRLKVKRWIF